MKEHHKVPVVKIESIRVHPNADTLEIIDIEGYQNVVKKGQFQVGDLAYYIYPDSVVPQRDEFKFLWEGRILEGEVPERYRRVKVRKFRKEWSEGLLMPINKANDFPNYWYLTDKNNIQFEVEHGEDVAERLGIYHYEPPEEIVLAGDCERGPRKKKYPKTIKGWFYFLLRRLSFGLFDKYRTYDTGSEGGPGFPIYDVEALKNHQGVFKNDEMVVITEKIHGSNFRAVYWDGKFYVGSRKLWKKEGSGCVWRRAAEQNPWIEAWCRKNPGYALYGEVTPTQDGYTYGATVANPRVFLFDVLDPQSQWVPWLDLTIDNKFYELINHWVPIIDERFYQEDIVKSYADGSTLVDKYKVGRPTHLREGIVIRPVNEQFVHFLGRKQLKLVSNSFLEKEK